MGTGTIKAIETVYKGCRFRSRLEARWAVFFDALGIKWEYEPEGYILPGGTWYLPDFWLPGVEMWAEVKPGEFSAVEEEKCRQLVRGTGHACLMLDGLPDVQTYWGWEYCDYGETSGAFLTETDYVLGEGHDYPRYEHRFFANTGHDRGDSRTLDRANYSEMADAVDAARSARFEHGEAW